ncbi:MAG: potassium transporter Trk [Deltaproteobacteria bacterium]|nr:potassium transporter Trk [Deltaproteobacteria bacterium]
MEAPRPTRFDVVHDLGRVALSMAPQPLRVSRGEALVAIASPVALVAVLAIAAFGVTEGSPAAWGALGIAGAVLLASLVREVAERDFRGIWRWVPVPLMPFFYDRPLTLAGVAGIRQLVMALRTFSRHPRGQKTTEWLWTHPVEFLAIGFAAVIGFGTLLLLLPAASTLPRGVSFVDALFTSTSATCVTGLTVVDTAKAYTPFGWAVIAAVIQVGGIGVMALSTLAAVVAGKRLGLAQSGAVAASMETTSAVDAVQIVKVVIYGTLITEGVGAVILFVSFLPDLPWHAAAGYAAFHSISAFCNAGFALWTDNICSYSGHAPVVLTVGFLIIFGGLGFLVLAELLEWIRNPARRRRPLSLHARIVLAATLVLIVGGSVLFALLEWRGAMEGLSAPEKVLNSFFQSVTTRTAGFNSVPMGGLTGATILLFIVLMFIGASPGSTGGGIKTSTATTILLAVRAYMRGREAVEVGGRAIPQSTVVRAVVLVALAATTCIVGFFLLLMTQDVSFQSLFFETVSAFATVGLSIGATAEVDNSGKLVLIALMYVGRVGPLTLILLLGTTASEPVRYPEEPVALT